MKKKILFFSCCLFHFIFIVSQNDEDALRYSRTGIGGSPRFVAMGGAFGALGADVSCAAYNPAGLGVFRKGEMIYSGGMRFSNYNSNFQGQTTNSPTGGFAFGNFGFAYSSVSQKDPTKRTTFCFSNSQLQNFNNQIQINKASTRTSISGDMVALANQNGNNLNPSYELLGYNTYLLDYDSASAKYFSFLDPKRNVSLNRNITTTGRMNEINLSLAQSADDKYYFGVSFGIPKIKFESTTTHSEADGNDSMRITLTSPTTYSSTYVDGLPVYHTVYDDKLGFNSLTYTEYYNTTGYGINLKLGGIIRVNPSLRLGAYYHTPGILYLSDTYYYKMATSFDANPNLPVIDQYPPPDKIGKFDYRIITPMKFGINGAYIFDKKASVALDIENLNYGTASINSNTPADFTGVNSIIKNKYKNATNIRLGSELNLKPVMIRAGYAIYGSPFGGLYSGHFDRQTVSVGFGFRSNGSFFADFSFAETFSSEKYYMYSIDPQKTDLKFNSSSFLVSVGFKF